MLVHNHLLIVLEYFCKFLVNVFTTQATGEDSAIRSEENNLRNAIDAINIRFFLLGIQYLRVWNTKVFDG